MTYDGALSAESAVESRRQILSRRFTKTVSTEIFSSTTLLDDVRWRRITAPSRRTNCVDEWRTTVVDIRRRRVTYGGVGLLRRVGERIVLTNDVRQW